MYTQNYSFGISPNPEAYITKGKNRIKQHNDVVYLNDGDQFEIEVFNPKTISVLAKIKINGNHISNSGLVIKPGQRIHLDRYLDEAKKFKFSTYDVSGANSEVNQAIKNNGLVEIEFYDEVVSSGFNLTGSNSTANILLGRPTWIAPYHTNNPYTVTYDTGVNLTYTATNIGLTDGNGTPKSLTKIETGRVEKGDNSDTKLKNFSGDFSRYSTYSITWRILPNSVKPVGVNELRNHCSGCGIRIKKSTWKFCPSCGNEL
jgi:hypothetical protein